MSDPRVLQPNARCPFCNHAFYVSEKFMGSTPYTCNGCGSFYPVGEARLPEKKK